MRPFCLPRTKNYVPVSIEGDGSLVDWRQYEASDEQLQVMKANGSVLQLNPGKLKVRFRKRGQSDLY